MFRKIGKKWIRRTKGVISIFLCIILTPVITLTGALIEYARYQDAAQISREAMNVSTTSVLANHDPYLYDRFGLMALDQQAEDPGSLFEKYFNENIAVSGKALQADNISATGIQNLRDVKILKQQIKDSGEITALAESMMDLGLDELLAKLNNCRFVTDLATVSDDMKNFTDSVYNLVDSAKKLKEKLQSAAGSTAGLAESAQAFTDSVNTLIENFRNNHVSVSELGENESGEPEYEITFSDNPGENVSGTRSELQETLEHINEEYGSSLEDCVRNAEELYDRAKEFQNSYNDITGALNEFNTAFETAKDSMESFNSPASGSSQPTADSSVTEDFLSGIVERFQGAADELQSSLADGAENAVNSVIGKIEADFNGIIGYGSFSVEQACDLIFSILKGDWDSEAEVYADLQAGIESLVDAVRNLPGIIENAIGDATDALKNSISDSVLTFFTTLKDAVNNLFHLHVIYDGSLNAYISNSYAAGWSAESIDNPYQDFLDGIAGMMNSAQDLAGNIRGANLLGALKSLKEFCSSVGTLASSITHFITATIHQIRKLCDLITDPGSLYDFVITCSYIANNVTNRLNYADGTALTGYSFSDISRRSPDGGVAVLRDLTALGTLITDLQSGGNDESFSGCEEEYVLAGTQSEIINQVVAFMDIYMFRLVLDLITVFTDEEVHTIAAGATIVSWAVYLIVVIGEPLCDTILLVNGAKVPMLKESCYLSPSGIPKLVEKLAEVGSDDENLRAAVTGDGFMNKLKGSYAQFESSGFHEGVLPVDYENYLLFLMMMTQNEDTLIKRFSNVVMMEADAHYALPENGGFDFDMNKTYTGVNAVARMRYNSWMPVFSFNGNNHFTKELRRQRGY